MDFIGEHYGRPIKKDDEENEGLAVDSKKTDDAYPKNLDAVDSEITGSQQTIKELIKIGKDRGFVTHNELDAGLPAEEYTPEEIDEVLSTLNEMGVSIVDIEHEEDPAALKTQTSHWSEQELLILRECWTHNMPISTIGRLIGKSRNAVAEKASEIQYQSAKIRTRP